MSTYDPSVFSLVRSRRGNNMEWLFETGRVRTLPSLRPRKRLRENRANAGFAVFQGNTFALAVPGATPVIGSVCA